MVGEILDGSITTAKLADNAVTAVKISTGAVTSAKIADGTIVAEDIADSTITGTKMVNSTITGAKIAASTITATNIANSTITNAKMAANSINSSNIVDRSITGTDIATNTIALGNLANDVITQLDGKAPKSHTHDASNITSGTLSADRLPTVPIAHGGTGATTAAAARANLGAASAASTQDGLGPAGSSGSNGIHFGAKSVDGTNMWGCFTNDGVNFYNAKTGKSVWFIPNANAVQMNMNASGADSWPKLTVRNGWAQLDLANFPCSKDDWGSVTVCTIPAGYRPIGHEVYAPVAKPNSPDTGDTEVRVNTDGKVQLVNLGGSQSAQNCFGQVSWCYKA